MLGRSDASDLARGLDRLEQRLISVTGLLRQIASLLERIPESGSAPARDSGSDDRRLRGDNPPVVLTQDRPFQVVMESPVPMPIQIPRGTRFTATTFGIASAAGTTYPLKVLRNDSDRPIFIHQVRLYRTNPPPISVSGVIGAQIQRVQYNTGGVGADPIGLSFAPLDTRVPPSQVSAVLPSGNPIRSEALAYALIPVGASPASDYASRLLETTGYPLWGEGGDFGGGEWSAPIVMLPEELIGIFLDGDPNLWSGTGFAIWLCFGT